MPRKHRPRKPGRRRIYLSQARVDKVRPESNLSGIARVLNVSVSTVRRWVQSGLPADITGGGHYIIYRDDLLDFLRVTGRYRPKLF